MLELRALMAMPGWIGLTMAASQLEPGHPVIALPALGFVLAVMPVRWFPALFPCQLLLAAGAIGWVPPIAGVVGWLGALFLALAWLLNAALFLRLRRPEAVRPNVG